MYIWYISLEFSVYQASNTLKLDLQRINVVIIKHGGIGSKDKNYNSWKFLSQNFMSTKNGYMECLSHEKHSLPTMFNSVR